MAKDIAVLFSENKGNIRWRYTCSSYGTKQTVLADNLLHLAARLGEINTFLSIFKESVGKDVNLLEYNEDHENPFHIAAKMGILPDIVKGIFKHLESEKTNPNSDSKKLEEVKSYVKDALGNRCALDRSKRTPLDWVSKTVKKEVREVAGIKDSLMCSRKFHLFLYVVGTIACTAVLCLSLYFLFLISQSLALASVTTIASGGIAYLSGKACSEIHDLLDVSTPVETFSGADLARVASGP